MELLGDDDYLEGEKLKAEAKALLAKVRKYVEFAGLRDKAAGDMLDDCENFLPEAIGDAQAVFRRRFENKMMWGE